MDIVAPVSDVRVRCTANPWMNPHILAGIKERDWILSWFKRNKENKALYEEYCKICNQATDSHFQDKVVQSRGNSGKLWGLLKSFGYSKASCSTSKTVLENDGVKIFDSLKVANVFNKFYKTVATKLVDLLPNGNGIFSALSGNF